MAATGKYGEPCVEHHTAMIYERGGARRISQVIDLAGVEWERVKDGMSTGSIAITGRSCRAQSEVLNQIKPRRHELVLFRGDERIWEGPIIQTTSSSSGFKISANDVIEYLDHTPLTKQWPSPAPGEQAIMTERIREIFLYELQTAHTFTAQGVEVTVPAWEGLSVPANIVAYLDIREGTTLTRSSTEAFQMSLGDHLYNLGRSIGVSYTTVGRRIIVWDGKLGQTRTVTEKDFSGDFEVIESGADFFNVATVVSTNVEEGESPSVGHATNDLEYYGPWSSPITTSSEDPDASEPSQTALDSQARRALSGLYPVPLIMNPANGTSLITSAGLEIAQLVPGVHVPVRAARNIRSVSQMQMLTGLRVTESPTGEIISANLEPAGDVIAV